MSAGPWQLPEHGMPRHVLPGKETMQTMAR